MRWRRVTRRRGGRRSERIRERRGLGEGLGLVFHRGHPQHNMLIFAIVYNGIMVYWAVLVMKGFESGVFLRSSSFSLKSIKLVAGWRSEDNPYRLASSLNRKSCLIFYNLDHPFSCYVHVGVKSTLYNWLASILLIQVWNISL